MRRALRWLIAGLLIVALAGLVVLRSPTIQDRVLRRVVERALATRANLFGDDALRVLLCGTGSPLPHATRAQACVAVFAGDRFWIVDTGVGSWNNLGLWRVDASRLAGILFTHFHSDHIGDLGEFNLQSWVAGRPGPLRVFGPPGVESVVAGFEQAYGLDTGYRIAHHGAELLPPEVGRMQAHAIPLPSADASVVLDEDGLRISAFVVDHAPVAPAYGYRFDYRGRSVVVSGDTVKSQVLVAAATGADVLVHEALDRNTVAVLRDAAASNGRPRVAKIMSDIPDYHTSPVEAAQSANEAGVQLLVLYHLVPPPPVTWFERIFTRGVEDVRPDGWVVADDGLVVELPVGSKTVIRRSMR